MEDTNQVRRLKRIKNLHITAALMASVASGYHFAVAIHTNEPGEMVAYSILGLAMVGITVNNTLSAGKVLTKINDAKQNNKN